MANRSYLCTYHSGENPAYRDVSEWRCEPPLALLLLVEAEPTISASAIWQVDAKIAIQGDAGQSRSLFLAFEEVRQLVGSEGATLQDARHERLRQLQGNWEKHLGLSFADTLYHHLGS